MVLCWQFSIRNRLEGVIPSFLAKAEYVKAGDEWGLIQDESQAVHHAYAKRTTRILATRSLRPVSLAVSRPASGIQQARLPIQCLQFWRQMG